MKRLAFIVLLLVVAGAAGGGWWWYAHHPKPDTELVLYGNVDLRQVQLAFNNNERIVEVLAKEGDHVQPGKVLARLDTSRLEPQVAQAEAQVAQAKAQVAAQEAVVARMHHGAGPEEIAQARANLESARADAANVRLQYDRMHKLSAVRLKDQSEVRAVSQEDVDNAKAALDVADAKVTVNQKALDLADLGPRDEDKTQAEAQLRGNEAMLRANEAQLAFLKRQLADAELLAPANAVMRTRLLEPGEMVSPQKAVFSLAITDPKWVRAYVGEPDLGKVREGMVATVTVDSFPDRRFEGWVGFISPVAEFTPKAVQTEELRTNLVYEVRVFVKDPTDVLRLGMPATVHLPRDSEDGQNKAGGDQP